MKRLPVFPLAIILGLLLISGKPIFQEFINSGGFDFKSIVNTISDNGWIYFKGNVKIDPKVFFVKYRNELGLTKDDQFRYTKDVSDSIYKYFRFQQYHKNIMVEGAFMTIQLKKDLPIWLLAILQKIFLYQYLACSTKSMLLRRQKNILKGSFSHGNLLNGNQD